MEAVRAAGCGAAFAAVSVSGCAVLPRACAGDDSEARAAAELEAAGVPGTAAFATGVAPDGMLAFVSEAGAADSAVAATGVLPGIGGVLEEDVSGDDV